MYVYVYFFCRFFKIGDKKTQWETYTPAGRGGGGGGAVLPEGLYIMCRFIGLCSRS